MDDEAISPLKKQKYFLFEKINFQINEQMTARGDWEFAYELLLFGKVCVRLGKGT